MGKVEKSTNMAFQSDSLRSRLKAVLGISNFEVIDFKEG
jgi:hypothetical protein